MPAMPMGIAVLRARLQTRVREDPLDDGLLQDRGDDLPLTAAVRAVLHGDLDCGTTSARSLAWDASTAAGRDGANAAEPVGRARAGAARIVAASVLLAALNNLLPMRQRRRRLITRAFRLVHGFGFAAGRSAGAIRSGRRAGAVGHRGNVRAAGLGAAAHCGLHPGGAGYRLGGYRRTGDELLGAARALLAIECRHLSRFEDSRWRGRRLSPVEARRSPALRCGAQPPRPRCKPRPVGSCTRGVRRSRARDRRARRSRRRCRSR